MNDNYSLAYYQGYIRGICDYAVWKDGKQYVGALQKPLRKVLEEVQIDAMARYKLELDIDQYARKEGA